MKALVYRGPHDVRVEDVDDATIEDPTDAIIRITTTNICGSDLHMYEGRTAVEEGTVLGHENTGVIEEVGSAVGRFKAGDRVSVPFNIGCGTCKNCQTGWSSFCTRMNPIEGMDGAAYGYANMGPYRGGQAEYLRVPLADFNLLALPQGTEHENDFTMLSDVFPTGWHGVELSGMKAGETVAVFGGGPVGLMAAHAAMIKGASQVFVVDQQADRLRLAEQIGATPIDFSAGDPADQIIEATHGAGTDRGVEAVGYQAHDHQGDEHPELVLDNLVKTVRTTGGIGVVGVYVPEDPDAADEGAKEGRIGFDYGTFFTKGQSMGTGQAPVKRYNRELRDLIVAGRATPGWIVSHELSLGEAADGYDHFDKREDGWTKVLLHP
ncbi:MULTISPECIES: glutathione-independent formaldehyde dehydrogenase [Aeromicrobium]|uniref:glutathione-independent formaldehyde dehydrogenase n=1 Tax=Aeromicrobium TaxID=2040 RepID=UPI0006F86E0F|nr:MULTISPECIES: glutathione-independent formaldehyde dehydrogenase [Aeromicrobium]KQX75849.1 aldehyde dehydrogenase [Aeromicrobium sp. Root472D3]MBD8606399.1 glutathione-independent formaldehyde dehydrogenase [Aeromicrobium sp. CFBP 8757]MCL8250478.1 glutathione-independent formaldehyde dehydrogenase [Aeromicrobium fastidiosum]